MTDKTKNVKSPSNRRKMIPDINLHLHKEMKNP